MNDGVVITNVCVPHMPKVVSVVDVVVGSIMCGPIVDVKVAVLVYHRRRITPCEYIHNKMK